MNEGNSRGVNVDLNMLNKPGTFLSAHALALYNWLKSPQGLDEVLVAALIVYNAPRVAIAALPGTATRLRGVLCPTLCVTDFPEK